MVLESHWKLKCEPKWVDNSSVVKYKKFIINVTWEDAIILKSFKNCWKNNGSNEHYKIICNAIVFNKCKFM